MSKYSFLLLAILLFTLSLLFNKLYSNRTSVEREAKLAENYIRKHQHDFEDFLKDTALVNSLLQNRASLESFRNVVEKKYSIYLYSAEAFAEVSLKFWSDKEIVPSQQLLVAADGERFQKLSNGYYFSIKKTFPQDTNGSKVVAYALIPIRSEYFITTKSLAEEFVFSSKADRSVMISEKPTQFTVKSATGKTLFYLNVKSTGAVPYNDIRTIILKLAAILCLFLFVHLWAEQTAIKKGAWRGVGLLALIVVGIRVLIYLIPSILNLRQFPLFDPAIYGADFIHRSLGDLMINAALFCWIILFAWSKLQQRENLAARFSPETRRIISIVSLLFLIFSTFTLASVIKSLVADSKISFDVTDFFGLSEYTLLGFIVLACMTISYYYFSQLLFRLIFPLFEGKNYLIYFAISFVGLIWLTVRSGQTEVLFNIPVLLWLLAYTWLMNRKGIIISRFRINIASILSWIFIFSLSIAGIMLIENEKKEWKKRKASAEKVTEQSNEGNETLMSVALKYLDNDFLLENFSRFRNLEEGKFLRDSIINNNYRGYQNKFDTRLYVYDSIYNGIDNEEGYSYEALNTILTEQAVQTQTPGIYFYETSFERYTYITRRDVLDTSGQVIGTIFIVSSPKSYSSDGLYPELFKEYGGDNIENSVIYSVAVYDDGLLETPPGKYPFPISLTPDQIPNTDFEKRDNGDYTELWHRASGQKVVVIARKKETMIEAITLFSYIFCSFLFLVALVQFMSFIVRTALSRKTLRELMQLNIRTQVHSTIIFISVFSFLIIGAATISFFISRYNKNNEDKLSRTMKIMVNEVEKRMSQMQTFDDVIQIYDSVSNDDLKKLVDDVSEIHGVDVNVYDLKGDLHVSSQSLVYTKGVLSKKMDPLAYFHLSRFRQVQHAKQEQIGKFPFLSIYSPVREEGIVRAYINIPYFTSNAELRQQISNFLVTIINLNAFIFLVAGLIALMITNRITRSFTLISDKMKEVNLGKLNEEIAWNRNDEIGELVQEYNKMVTKLGESAAALAKSEREGAWREMARQVAHEIKNPLTPMKLSIQYLQKAISNNQPNVQELSANVANTLVEQIDHLSKIAADFSQFANIGNTKVEQFDLHDIIGSLRDLFQPQQNVQFEWYPINDKVLISADRTQMNRLFTNLFTNAVEACRDRSNCKIEVNERREGNDIIISIADNGEGIPDEMQSRIFMPNFTTKSSGTGLGLAMCKGIVEQAKGDIWFETEQGKGTTFFVLLPLVS